jgi:hypothetical protein
VPVKPVRADLEKDAPFRARFGREVAPARRVGGLCTAPVHDSELDEDRPWEVTDFGAEPNLADLKALQVRSAAGGSRRYDVR